MFVTMLAVGFTSCISDDNLIDNRPMIDGLPAEVSLEFEVNEDKEITRAAQSEYYEYLVQNIYVMVFSNGARVQTDLSFFSPNDTSAPITNYRNKADQAGNTQSSGTVSFGAISGSNLTICAIANVGISNTSITRAEIGDEVPIDVTTLDAVKTYKELQELSIRLSGANINRGASFMMTGEVIANLAANETTTVTIPLKRADSKITFNVKAQNPDPSKYSDFIFLPGKWRVVNAPLKSYILPRTFNAGDTLTEDLDATSAKEDFYTVAEANAPQFEVVGNNQGSFTFYMYENLKAPEALISATGNVGYALRELQQKNTPTETDVVVSGQQYINGDYVNAPKDATYVIITGELSYNYVEPYTDPETGITQDLQKWVMADVEYCIHLGHSGVANVNDYSTLRNHHYTYNVTVQGVNDLIVEVDNGNQPEVENRPGAEGDVVMSAQRVINVDGHYDRANIVLTDSEAEKLYFAVSTPWERGLDTNGFADINTTVRDYKWVKFLINKEVNQANNNFAPFPGEQCYDGGVSLTGTAAQSGAYGTTVTLRDIRQLSNYLKDATNRNNAKSSDGKIYITVFVDEYLYYYDPTVDPMVGIGESGYTTKYKSIVNATDASSLILWKKSVNQQDRMLHIVKAGEMEYSADGETSLSKSVVTIKQRAIMSFYNVNAESLTSAWGTETINETGTMSTSGSRSLPSNLQTLADYPRAQRLVSEGSPKWASVISASNQYGLLGSYNDATYACAMRNRDLDGDGTIDQNEMQWYLTSLNQISDLWVGDPAMPAHAKLYDATNSYDWTYTHWESGGSNGIRVHGRHYITSTWDSGSSATSLKTFWAEQYGATSTYSQSSSWVGLQAAAVRCIRHLGMPYTSTDAPMSYYKRTDNSDGSNSISLDYMNIVALRETFDEGNGLPYSHLGDVGYNNSPYFGFNVLPGYYGNNGVSSTTTWYRAYRGEQPNADVSSICPDGYRMPTQREMLIMLRALDEGSWTYNVSTNNLTRGGYAIYNGQNIGNYNSRDYFGRFYYFPDEGLIQRRVSYGMTETGGPTQWGSWSNTTCAVRCVQDNKDAKHSSSSDYGDTGGDLPIG